MIVELSLASILATRFALAYDFPVGKAIYAGIFHAISAFNNAGLSLFATNLIGFATDPWVLLPISIAIILGGIGFPVIIKLSRLPRPRRWSLHTKMTVTMTAALLVGGAIFMTVSEWGNPQTMGDRHPGHKLMLGWFHAVQPRTGGYNAWDYGKATDETVLATILLMFVGGGSAGTAGGLKVTTFLLLFFVILAEVRGEGEVPLFAGGSSHASSGRR